ncbi:DUF3052 domain-containing protein [Hamadaea sp. NPDC051192]|uniref:DUF3052 domain-containing protein n=1 Tax=Hamadaea sp. NPDC051192 TaxID=3154940 RepID=UPI003418DA1C
MSGYSGTPLPRKLGITPTTRLAVLHQPAGLTLDLGVTAHTTLRGPHDVILLFTTSRATLLQALPRVRTAMTPDAAFWVCWPKQTAVKKGLAAPTDLTEDAVRDIALPTGLVDVKVAAIDDTWSGLKLVIRRELR